MDDIGPAIPPTDTTKPLDKRYWPIIPTDREPDLPALGMMENCAFKSCLSGVAGGAMGFAFSFMMGAFDNSMHSYDAAFREKSTREQLKEHWKQMKVKGKGMAKQFAKVGFIYSGVECMVEKKRGEHDLWNPAIAGCLTGGGLAFSSGPVGTAMGCGTFAAFSVAIDLYMASD